MILWLYTNKLDIFNSMITAKIKEQWMKLIIEFKKSKQKYDVNQSDMLIELIIFPR